MEKIMMKQFNCNNNKNKINNNIIIENKNNLPINNNKHNINNKYLSSLTNYYLIFFN